MCDSFETWNFYKLLFIVLILKINLLHVIKNKILFCYIKKCLYICNVVSSEALTGKMVGDKHI